MCRASCAPRSLLSVCKVLAPLITRVRGSPPGVGPHLTGGTGGSAGVIAARAMWPETWLQRRRTYQAVIARGIGRVITANTTSPETGRRGGGTNQPVMTRSIGRVITAYAIPAVAGRSTKGTLLA